MIREVRRFKKKLTGKKAFFQCFKKRELKVRNILCPFSRIPDPFIKIVLLETEKNDVHT